MSQMTPKSKKKFKPPHHSARSVEVIIEDLKSHPICAHGPTLLFSTKQNGEKNSYFACSACRNRKHCQFFLWKNDLPDFINKKKCEVWNKEREKYIKDVNHRKRFLKINQIKAQLPETRFFCRDCLRFITKDRAATIHENHRVISCISDYQLSHPSEFLPPLDDSKKEAQYLFAKKSVKDLVDILKDLGIMNVICIGTPRIHEHIRSECPNMSSILLDFDKRFHSFFGPLEYGWYNFFNNHFFFRKARLVFENFLRSTGGKNTILITDPPFGGRIEPLADSLRKINDQYKKLNKSENDLPVFWIFPYFMEPQVVNFLPDFRMLDYKVQYENHPLFQHGPKGRKQGSPVRVFTNINPSLIKLPSSEYKYCQECQKWISLENQHCKSCNACTSKNGETYVHCRICQKCVKPNWQHCNTCQRCVQLQHQCGKAVIFKGACLTCQESGHKKSDCPKTNKKDLKRKKPMPPKGSKKTKTNITTLTSV